MVKNLTIKNINSTEIIIRVSNNLSLPKDTQLSVLNWEVQANKGKLG